MQAFFFEDSVVKEIGVDEAGRGPMFGRVYAAAVVLKRDKTLDYSMIKDSKRFSSFKKLTSVANHIMDIAEYWAVAYRDEKTIDNLNILEATQFAMHDAISQIQHQMQTRKDDDLVILVDGNYFHPFVKYYGGEINQFLETPYCTLVQGDSKVSSIAAASILAKWHRDSYIAEMVALYPALDTIYHIGHNKGYGGKTHMEAIREHGVSPWHRMTFGLCATVNKQCNAFPK